MLNRKISYFPFPTNQDSSLLKEILTSSGLTSNYFKVEKINNYEYLDVEDTTLHVELKENNDSKIKKYTLSIYRGAEIAETTIEDNRFHTMKLIQTSDRYLPKNLEYVPQLEELYSARYKFTNQIALFLQSIEIPKVYKMKMEKIPVWSTTLPDGLKISLLNTENKEPILIEISPSSKENLLVNMQSHENHYRIEYSSHTYWKEKVINQVKEIVKNLLLKKVEKNIKENEYGFKPGFLIGKRF